MIVTCDKCKDADAFRLNLTEDKVFCTSCKSEVNASKTIKAALKAIGQTSRAAMSKKINCTSCNNQGSPILVGDEASNVFCPACKAHQVNLTKKEIDFLKSLKPIKVTSEEFANYDPSKPVIVKNGKTISIKQVVRKAEDFLNQDKESVEKAESSSVRPKIKFGKSL